MTQTYSIHPDRKRQSIRPLTAWRHMQNLIKDKEDTEQVFHIITALDGRASERDFKRAAGTPRGKELLAEKVDLPALLDDHAAIRARCTPGSVGLTYVEFMEREGLSARGLVEESEKFLKDYPKYGDDFEYYMHRRRDTHDMLHILTGYGRDALGEASVLAFTNSQHGGLGSIFISIVAAWQVKKYAPKGTSILRCIGEAKRNGKAASTIAAESIYDLLAEDLDAARIRLGVKPAVAYHAAMAAFAADNRMPCVNALAE